MMSKSKVPEYQIHIKLPKNTPRKARVGKAKEALWDKVKDVVGDEDINTMDFNIVISVYVLDKKTEHWDCSFHYGNKLFLKSTFSPCVITKYS